MDLSGLLSKHTHCIVEQSVMQLYFWPTNPKSMYKMGYIGFKNRCIVLNQYLHGCDILGTNFNIQSWDHVILTA